DIDDPSLRKFLDFRHLEGDLADPDTEHYHYQSELNTISKNYVEESEVGQKVLKLRSDFEERWNALSVVVFGWKAHMDNLWVECSQEKDGMLVDKKSRLIKLFWDLQNICAESELINEKSKLQWKGNMNLKKTGLCYLKETSSSVQEKQISDYKSRERSKTQANNVYEKVNICTPKRTIISEDGEASEDLRYSTSPKHISKKTLPNPFLVNQQVKKHGFETEEDGDEYDADLTIVGGISIEWIVNGIQIRERLKEYQLKGNLPKTRPEYYDIIFFNSNKVGFLETLDEKTENSIENEIRLLLDRIIDRDIKKTKEKLKQVKEEDIALFENKFALYFVRHMVRLMEDINLLLDPLSEGTYINSVLAPILDEFFVKNKRQWRLSYGETCLKANAKDRNSQKQDFERRSIVELQEENEEFSVIEISGPPMKNVWSHFMNDRLKIAKMLKTIMNHLAELNPSSDITLVKLYGLQSYRKFGY
ncbi:23593_t:CDS:2, partial [Dentiscutata erythropus]